MGDKMAFYRMLRDFLAEHLTVLRSASIKTVRAYKQSLNQFRIYLREEKGIPFEKVDISFFSRNMVYGFLVYLRDIRNCSTATLNLYLSSQKRSTVLIEKGSIIPLLLTMLLFLQICDYFLW